MKSLTFLNPVFTLSQVVARYFVGQVITVIINFIYRRLTRMNGQSNHGVSEAYENLFRNIIASMVSKRDKRILKKAAAIISNTSTHEAYFASLISDEDVYAIATAKKIQLKAREDMQNSLGGNL